MSHYKIYTFLYCVVNVKVPLTSSHQIIKQAEVIQKVVLTVVSKLNDSALDKKRGDQPEFYPRKDSG